MHKEVDMPRDYTSNSCGSKKIVTMNVSREWKGNIHVAYSVNVKVCGVLGSAGDAMNYKMPSAMKHSVCPKTSCYCIE